MTKRYPITFELSLHERENPSAAPLLSEVLQNMGISQSLISESNNGFGSRACAYLDSYNQARRYKREISALGLKGVRLHLKRLLREDWERKGKENFKPFLLMRGIEVAPIAQKLRHKPKTRQTLFLETAGAFGSGLHETTKFMAQLIASLKGKFETFLDAGTGSGILAMVAAHFGAKEVSAFEIDPQALKTAQQNFDMNGFRSIASRAADIKKVKGQRQFDFVAANLITKELISAKDALLSFVRPGKFLAVSGISRENFYALKQAFRGLPLRCLKVKEGKEWVAVLYQRHTTHVTRHKSPGHRQ